MKANEAPEKIYLFESPMSGYLDDRWLSRRCGKDDIEYTRTDAFIEKVIEYIITHIPEMHILGNNAKIDECIIEDFKKYMKEE